MNLTVGIASLNYYIPSGRITSEEMAKKSNIPEWVFTEKIGIRRKPIAARDEHPTEMGLKKDIDFLFTNQVKKSLSYKILKAVGVKEEQTYISLSEYGHLGSVDNLFCLARTIENKKIDSGDIVVLASSAAGFSWAALIVEYLGFVN